MKPTTKGESLANYTQKQGWKLQPHHKERNTGTSETVPDMSITIKQLVQRVGAGMDPSITRVASYTGEEEEVDHEDLDLAKISRMDIGDTHQVLASVRETIKVTKAELDEFAKKSQQDAKMAAEKKAPKVEDKREFATDAEERPEEKIPLKVETQRSRKYEPKGD